LKRSGSGVLIGRNFAFGSLGDWISGPCGAHKSQFGQPLPGLAVLLKVADIQLVQGI
jgi:hypothetical protein